MKQLLHGIAGGVLHSRGQERAEKERKQRIIAAPVQTEEDSQSAVTINWTDGAVEEAPLFAELPLAQGAVDHLTAPAEKTVNHEKKKNETKTGHGDTSQSLM